MEGTDKLHLLSQMVIYRQTYNVLPVWTGFMVSISVSQQFYQ